MADTACPRPPHRGSPRPLAAGRVALGLALLLTTACDRSAGQAGTELPQHYDDKDSALAGLEDPERDAWALPDRVVAALPIERPDMVVADIGAGSGYFSRRIAARVPEGKVVAVDVDADFVDYVEEHRDAWGTPNIEPRLAMYDNALLPADSVDVVFLSNTYAYIRDRDTYFAAISRALRTGGRLVIVGFRVEADLAGVKNAPTVAQRVRREDVIAQLEGLGLALDHEEDFLPHQYFLVFRRP